MATEAFAEVVGEVASRLLIRVGRRDANFDQLSLDLQVQRCLQIDCVVHPLLKRRRGREVRDRGVARSHCRAGGRAWSVRRATNMRTSSGPFQTGQMVRAWRIGGRREAAWIDAATSVGTRITAGIPPVFVRYATVVIPDDDAARTRSDTALVGVLSAHTLGHPWWFGYLETGGADVICADAARVSVYAGWPYVLLEADAEQALT